LSGSDGKLKGEREPIDLTPYISGQKKMFMKCHGFDGSGCGKDIDITADFIAVETQNNLRKTSPDYFPSRDELVIPSRKCEVCQK